MLFFHGTLILLNIGTYKLTLACWGGNHTRGFLQYFLRLNEEFSSAFKYLQVVRLHAFQHISSTFCHAKDAHPFFIGKLSIEYEQIMGILSAIYQSHRFQFEQRSSVPTCKSQCIKTCLNTMPAKYRSTYNIG